MPAYTLMRLLVSVLMTGSCLPPPARCQGQQDPPPVVEIYPTCGRSSEPRFTTVKISIINQAMLGVDPLTFDLQGKRNSGLKDQIFNAMSSITGSPDAFELKDFIGKAIQDVECAPLASLPIRTLRNYNEYRDIVNEVVSFKSEDDIMAGSRRLCTVSNDEEEKFVDLFQLGGEVVLGEAYCRTHTVSVNLNTKPTFTENFHNALKKICSAAGHPITDRSRKIFRVFVEDFGTHYQDTTSFGSRLLLMKLFTKKAANYSESAERHSCVSSSFTRSNFHPMRPSLNFDKNVLQFIRAVTQCDDSEQASDVLNSLGIFPAHIITMGTLPFSDQDATLQRPVPIQYRLEKISQMFQEDWFASLGCGVGGTVMQEFFENMTSEYQNAFLGASCASAKTTGCGYNSDCGLGEKCFNDNTANEGFFCMDPCEIDDICPDNTVCIVDGSHEGYSCKKGCHFTSNCTRNTVCVDDESEEGFVCRKRCSFTGSCPPKKVCVDDLSYYGYSCVEPCKVREICASDEACYAEEHNQRGYICVSTKPVRAVIAGGHSLDGQRTVEHVNFKSFPDLPVEIISPGGATAGDHLVLCGEVGNETNKCYRINTTSPGNEWEAIPVIPSVKSYKSAVTIGKTKIWFIDNNNLFEFDGETLHFTIIKLPFIAKDYHCAVANGTHAYVVGAGAYQHEIWVNRRAMDATAWRQVESHRLMGIHRHACLWYGPNIIMTGGAGMRSDVLIFNTETRETRGGKSLLTGRMDHQMMLLDGMPTVLGGRGNDGILNTFESFSLESNRWENLTRTLASPRAQFALVEV